MRLPIATRASRARGTAPGRPATPAGSGWRTRSGSSSLPMSCSSEPTPTSSISSSLKPNTRPISSEITATFNACAVARSAWRVGEHANAQLAVDQHLVEQRAGQRPRPPGAPPRAGWMRTRSPPSTTWRPRRTAACTRGWPRAALRVARAARAHARRRSPRGCAPRNLLPAPPACLACCRWPRSRMRWCAPLVWAASCGLADSSTACATAPSLAAAAARRIAVVERAFLRTPAHLLSGRGSRMVAIWSGEVSLKLDSANGCAHHPRSRCTNMPTRSSSTAILADMSTFTFAPAVRRPAGTSAAGWPNLNGGAGVGRRHRRAPAKRVSHRTLRGLQRRCPRSECKQASQSRARRMATPPRRSAAVQSAIDARRQHDRRRGALDAIERADAIDQVIEFADRCGRRRWRCRSNGPLTECSVRTSGMRRSAASMASDLRGSSVISTCARTCPASTSAPTVTV